MHKLRQYLKSNNINQKDFAVEINVSAKHLSRILNGHSSVSLELGLRIQEKTSGFVAVADFAQKSA